MLVCLTNQIAVDYSRIIRSVTGHATCAVYDQYSRDQEDKKKEMADYYIDSYMELGSAE